MKHRSSVGTRLLNTKEMTNEEIYKETLIIFILMIILVLIAYISDNLKKKYEDKISKSNNKILKFIFKYVL